MVSGITYTAPGMAPEKLDLYLPGGTPPAGGWPVMLAFPGGGWRWASRQQYGQEVAVLTQAGFAVAGVDYAYAGSTPNGSHTWPVPLEDAQQAVRWARAHAAAFHLNPDEVVAMGDSAGAHLALLLATYPSGPVQADAPPGGPTPDASPVSDRVQAVVDFYGPTDLTALYDESRSAVLPYFDTFLGGSPLAVPRALRRGVADHLCQQRHAAGADRPGDGRSRPTYPSQSLALDAGADEGGRPPPAHHDLLGRPTASASTSPGFNLTGDVVQLPRRRPDDKPIPETLANP